MLQEATRAINSAFNNSFIKKLSQYLHDCVREEVKSSTFRNLKADKDNKWIFLDEEDITGKVENIGYMLQKDYLLDWRTVYKNVLIGLEIKNMLNAESKKYALDLLKMYGLRGIYR